MAVSIYDIAAKAGVSGGTVSRALNAKSGARISAETRERVRRIADDLGYQPNAVARSLRRQSTNIIGFYTGYGLSDTRKPFYAEIISGLEAGCEEQGQDLLIHTALRRRPISEIYSELLSGQVAGVVMLFPPGDDKQEEAHLIQRLAQSHLPAVVLADCVPHIPSVRVDDAAGSRLLAEHLAGRGHRVICYLPGPTDLPLVMRRRLAFAEAARALEMSVIVPDGYFNEESDLGPLTEWLAAGPGEPEDRPTAVVCWFDELAFNLLAECRRQGVRVPQDLAVVGFDGIRSLEVPAQKLTTIRAPWREVARSAMTLLTTRIARKEIALETVLPVELIIGETT